MGLQELQKSVVKFRDERNWKQFHNAKDMALSLSLEAAELLELTQWKSQQEIEIFFEEHKDKLADELADVLYWVLLLAHDYKVDLTAAFAAKMTKNREKYPVELAKNNKNKYSKLED